MEAEILRLSDNFADKEQLWIILYFSVVVQMFESTSQDIYGG